MISTTTTRILGAVRRMRRFSWVNSRSTCLTTSFPVWTRLLRRIAVRKRRHFNGLSRKPLK
jgi:hypothetical protein